MDNHEHLLIRAAFKKPVERTPVWVMRQAGRYLSEYRAVREQAGDFLSLCMNPELAAEVSIQPLELMEVDAVIMFSDILTPLMGMGMELSFDPSPKFLNPIKSERDIEALKLVDPDVSTPYVGKILNIIRKEINNKVPVIGFAGGPFTLASYLVEGEGSKLFSKFIKMLFDSPQAAHALMSKLTQMTIQYLNYQIENGAQMVQLFDTWAGILPIDDYMEFVFPYVSQIFSELDKKSEVPSVYYINGGHQLLKAMSKTGATVVGLDWRYDIGIANQLIGKDVALQGNLNPNILFCRPEIIKKKTAEILSKMKGENGHIFNLGHGIDKNVNPEHLKCMIKAVKELSKR